MMRTLVIHAGGIGDFLLAAPALAALAKESTIELLGQRDRLSLGVAMGFARVAHDFDTVDFHSVFHEPSARLTAFCAGFDQAVVWMRDEDGSIRRGLEAAGISKVSCFPGLPPEDWDRPASAYYAECLQVRAEAMPRIGALAETGPPLLVHPGSGGRHKNWPLDEFVRVVRRLSTRERPVGWILGPAEEGLTLPAGAHLVYRQSLVGLARLLAGARLYIGNDSGITHLAAAAGCPTVAIFGPTNPVVWAPRGSYVRVVQAVPWPVPEQVIAAAEELLANPGM
jgi:hypothetical protein